MPVQKPPKDLNTEGLDASTLSNTPKSPNPVAETPNDDEEVTFTVSEGSENQILGGEVAKKARKEADETRLIEYEKRVTQELNSNLNLKKLKILSEEMEIFQSRHIPEIQKNQLATWNAQVKAEINMRENNRTRGASFVAGVTAFFNAFMTGNFSGAWSIAKKLSQKVWDEGLNNKEAYFYAARESVSLAAANIIEEIRANTKEKKLKGAVVDKQVTATVTATTAATVVAASIRSEPTNDKPKVNSSARNQFTAKQSNTKLAERAKPKKARVFTTQFSTEAPPKDEPAPGGAHKKPSGPIANPGSIPQKAPLFTTQFSTEAPLKDEPTPGGAHKKPSGPTANSGSIPPPLAPTPLSPKNKS